ncbi:MAG: type III-B CRISPR module RAMP protein Cmr4 [Deltaproteobacteria bacterium]|nr:type III-B CRISPR module RAMP protein Cmr4 [Deltaproteobacteria bacterium]
MSVKLCAVRALSPIHCGTGQAIGGIDLPIARERPTNIPLIPGSSFKGVLRAMGTVEPVHLAVFGPEPKNASDNAGSVQFSDLNLLFLPVRSLRATFAWVTCEYMLRRFVRDAKEAKKDLPALPAAPLSTQAKLGSDRLKVPPERVIFEDFDFEAKQDPAWATWLQKAASILMTTSDDQQRFVQRACLVDEDVMAVLLETSMEVTARNRIDPETHTVAKGALWTEEALPVESILTGLVVATPVAQGSGPALSVAQLLGHVETLVGRGAVQVGGKGTVGRGMCEVRLT